MAVQSPRSYTGLFGNVVQAGIRAQPGERLPGHFENTVAIPLRIHS
jgi:hypothetical protein